jgi:hypothetical protein
MTQRTFLFAVITLFISVTASAKLKIPFGKVDKIQIVAELPDNEKYIGNKGPNDFLELATLHQEYNIAWIIPAWITEEPKLVLAKKDSDEYYELTEAELNEILQENRLDEKSLLNLGLYTRYGGKIILLLIIGLIIYGIIPSKGDDEREEKPFDKTPSVNG